MNVSSLRISGWDILELTRSRPGPGAGGAAILFLNEVFHEETGKY
jgi:hypothetical protein